VNNTFEEFVFRKGILTGLAASLVMVGSIRLVFTLPWLSFASSVLVVSLLLNAIFVPKGG
jgi:hypothetical protein